MVWLITHYADSLPSKTSKTNNYVASIGWHDFKEVSFVDYGFNNVKDVVRLVRRVRDDVIQSRYYTVTAVRG